jgi:hypothetical protein
MDRRHTLHNSGKMTVTANIGLTFIKSFELCAKYFPLLPGQRKLSGIIKLTEPSFVRIRKYLSILNRPTTDGQAWSKDPAVGSPAPGEWVVGPGSSCFQT